MTYGGFWVRVGAYIIDIVLLMIVFIPLIFIFGTSTVETTATSFSSSAQSDSPLLNLVFGLIGAAYFVGFESSSMQATPGKRAMGLVVTGEDGRRISVLRALGRYFSKILSSMILLIGYIMVAFTARKQGLHDMICSTLVVHAKPGETGVDPDVFS
ncbi:RDD family protein [uncultured Erythrobacter sp.]|uniref:RDD family protein n=1 Tax=uncultured Erythrobacter sp. TaxID=263913 RepID=UPI002622997C|nr:RDD family protein [uncultured Erythrobacter sp.]